MRLLVLFGAGASYGSGPVQPGRVPLGSELFDDLCEAFPKTWGALISSDEAKAFRGTPPFEKGMECLWERNDERLAPLLIDMALYFAQFSPSSSDNQYGKLLDQIGHHQLGATVFTSLNYDCMFELAVAERGWDIGYMPDPPPGCIHLLKPHGSCNFIPPMTRNVIGCTFSGSARFYEGPIEAVHPGELAPIYAKGASLPPAISLYTTGKMNLTAEGAIKASRGQWAEIVDRADLVIVIGVRPVLADSHVWDPLLNTSADLWFVGGEDGDFPELSERLGRRLIRIAPFFDAAVPIIGRRLTLLA